MIYFLSSFALLAISAFFARAWFGLLAKPTYMMEMTQYSRSALVVEKAYKLVVTAMMSLLSFAMAAVFFLEEFAKWPV